MPHLSVRLSFCDNRAHRVQSGVYEGADMDREEQTTSDGRALAEQFGRVGLWTRHLDVQSAKQVREAVAELEELGWGSLWFWEVFGREALTNAGLLLSATRQMVVASGIANVWARDPVAMAAAGRTLVEAYPGRFVLGIGVSHGEYEADELR